MSCELIRVNFKKGVVQSRELLGEEAPAYNPYKDEAFKAFTVALADVATVLKSSGGHPNKMIVIATDEDVELDMAVFDTEFLPTDQAIAGIKRVLAKLELETPDPEAV